MKKILFTAILLLSCEVKQDPKHWERICIYEEMERIDYILQNEIKKEKSDKEVIVHLTNRLKELTEKRLTLK